MNDKKTMTIEIPILDSIDEMKVVETFTKEQLWYVCAVAKAYEMSENKNKSLQTRWNSLREWLEKNIKEKPLLTTYFFECDGKQKSISGIELEELKRVLDKMNELEGGNNG